MRNWRRRRSFPKSNYRADKFKDIRKRNGRKSHSLITTTYIHSPPSPLLLLYFAHFPYGRLKKWEPPLLIFGEKKGKGLSLARCQYSGERGRAHRCDNLYSYQWQRVIARRLPSSPLAPFDFSIFQIFSPFLGMEKKGTVRKNRKDWMAGKIQFLIFFLSVRRCGKWESVSLQFWDYPFCRRKGEGSDSLGIAPTCVGERGGDGK